MEVGFPAQNMELQPFNDFAIVACMSKLLPPQRHAPDWKILGRFPSFRLPQECANAWHIKEKTRLAAGFFGGQEVY